MSDKTSNTKPSKIKRLFQLPQHYAALQLYKKNENLPGMYRHLKKLSRIYRDSPSYHLRLYELAYQQKLWKQALGHVNKAIERADKETAVTFYQYKAECLIKLNEPSKAAMCLKVHLLIHPDDDEAWLKQATEYSKARQWQDAINSFKSYLHLHPDHSFAQYQLGECYRHINDVESANIAYQHALKNIDHKLNNQTLAWINYKQGLMLLDKDEASATESFNRAIRMDKDLNSKRWGIGIFHEQNKEWTYAIDAYEKQLSTNHQDAELNYKIATLLNRIEQSKTAIKYYEKALSLDRVQSKWHFALAICYEKLGDYTNAAKWYKSAIVRQQNHSPGNYRRLGFVLEKLGKPKEALESYNEAELFRRLSFVNKKFHDNQVKKAEVRYAISYEHYPVDEKMIFYESLGGARMMGNPYAIFEHIYDKSDFKDYTHVWVVKSFQVIPEEFRHMNNMIFVKKGTDAYLRYIATAKYLICNSSFEDFVVRKPEQLFLQTSHGIFYKTVGRESIRSPLGVAGSTRNLLQATHIIVPNEYMAQKQPNAYSIKGINGGQIAKIGYPRIDVTLNASEDTKNQIKAKLQLDPAKKTVLYLPTWRGSTKKSNRFDSEKLVQDLKKLAELDVNIIFRGHTITNKLLRDVDFPKNVITPPPEIQTNELLSIGDVLISDYSSVFFDFIPTERPIMHYLYDLEEYKQERGLNLTEDELPGKVVKTIDQLVQGISNSLDNHEPSSHYLEAKKRFCPYDDGNSSARAVRWFFYGDDEDIERVDFKKESKSYLYLGGLLSDPSRIDEMVSEINELKENKNTVSIMLKRKLAEDEDRFPKLQNLNTDINFLAHAGKMPVTIEEARAIEYLQSHGEFTDKEMESAYKHAFEREARRLFGDSQFDDVFNYETDSNYWNGLRDQIQTKKDKKNHTR